jgi:transcription elongation factor Elf1
MAAKGFTCPECKRAFAPKVPKVTVEGRTLCGDCTYRAEVNPEPPGLVKPRQRRKPGAGQLTL